jgi:Uma2 family endonuclease
MDTPMGTSVQAIPPLQGGDHLTSVEFERRWDAMPNLKVAELLDGIVYLPQTGSHTNHAGPCARLISWTGFYTVETPGVDGGCHSTLRLDERNEPQPDVLLMIEPSSGGRTRIDDDDFVANAPDWIGEVTATSASYDLHVKLDVYRRHGVREYVVWRVFDREIDWFVLRGGQYERLPLSEDGLYRSEFFPGLWLDPQALIAEDLPKLQAIVQRGLATREHQQFVEQLAWIAEKP